MHEVQHIHSEQHSEHYGILCQSLTGKELSKPSVAITHCSIPPLGNTTPHAHREAERFVILEGSGVLIRNAVETTVRAGDVVWMPAFTHHELKNTSSTTELKFLSVYSEGSDLKKVPKQIVITVAPPTPNGELHLGHLGGPYAAADMHRRFYKMLGSQVLLMGGTDDFQNYIARKAIDEDLAPDKLTQSYRDKIAWAFHLADIPLDFFLSPATDKEYQKFVQTFFAELLEKKVFEQKELTYFFLTKEKRYAFESEIQGLCPVCESFSVGNCCEDCGAVVDVANLKNPRHIQDRPLERHMLKGYVFNFDQSLESSITALASEGQDVHRISHLLIQMRKRPEIFNYAVTYPGCGWGIPVLNDPEGRIINVWVEMAASYAYLSQKSEKNFLTTGGAEWYHAFGFDNSYYYSFLIPALLKAHTPEFQGPRKQLSNEFFLLNGKKFSTSRKHALWAIDILEKVPSDLVRFYLAHEHPSFEQSNFSMLAFEKFLNSFISRLEKLFANSELKKATLDKGKSLSTYEQKILLNMNCLLVRFEENFLDGKMALRKNTRLCLDFLEVIEEVLPTSSSLALLGLRTWANLIHPFMPRLSTEILSHFTITEQWIRDLQMTGEPYDGRAFDLGAFTVARLGFEAFKAAGGKEYAHN